MEVIVYKQDNGQIALVVPSKECPLTVEEIARKDVPTGKPYAILDRTEIPQDQIFFEAWTIDDADLKDGVGA